MPTAAGTGAGCFHRCGRSDPGVLAAHHTIICVYCCVCRLQKEHFKEEMISWRNVKVLKCFKVKTSLVKRSGLEPLPSLTCFRGAHEGAGHKGDSSV